MNEDLIYSITPEEDERAKALRDKDWERNTALRARLAELDRMGRSDDPSEAERVRKERDGIYRELVSLSLFHRRQNVRGADFINELSMRDETGEASELARRLMPGYYLWAHCDDEKRLERETLFRTVMNYSLALHRDGNIQESAAYMQLALKEFQLMTAEEGRVTDTRGAIFYAQLPFFLYTKGQLDAAGPITEEGQRYFEELRKELSEEEYARKAQHTLYSIFCQFRAVMLLEAGKNEECEQVLLEHLRVQKKVWESYPEENRDDHRCALYYLGTWYMFRNRFDEALPLLAETAEVLAQNERMGISDKAYYNEHMYTYLRLEALMRRNGREKEADEYRRKAAAYEEQLPEDRKGAHLFLSFGRLLRASVYEFVEDTARTQGTDHLRPAVLIRPGEWERIRRYIAKDRDFSEILAFADESPRGDQSEGVLVTEQGIYISKKKKSPKTYSWYDIEETAIDEDGSLGIRERGFDKGAYDWFRLRDAQLMQRLIRTAQDCVDRKSRLGAKRDAAPVPDRSVMEPEAVFERFHARKRDAGAGEVKA